METLDRYSESLGTLLRRIKEEKQFEEFNIGIVPSDMLNYYEDKVGKNCNSVQIALSSCTV